MNEVINQVTPLTRGIIWLTKDETNVNNPHYKGIDYLLDGLLTLNLKSSSLETSKVLVGKNFEKLLYVMVVKEIKRPEIESFITLVKNDLGPENDIIVIDEWDGMDALLKEAKVISANLRSIR